MSTDRAPDPWDVVLDEEFVRAGRWEAAAEERVAAAQRIAREHERATAWRSSGDLPPGSRAPGPGRRRPGVLPVVLLLLVAALVGWSWQLGRPGTPLGTPAAAPAGEGGYRFLNTYGDGRPVTFDPCRPVHYVVRPDGQPPGGAAAVAAAVAEVSRATGLQFVDDGLTDAAPRDPGRSGPWSPDGRGDPVLVAWSTAAESPELADGVAGYAGPLTVQSDDPASARYVSGQVVLDAEDLAHAPGDPHGEAAVRRVLLHELGHLVGLDHVDDPAQLLHAEAGTQAGYGPGDLRGLHELGLGECR